jgi:acyl-CoA synthetase (AMP-forming)/AMP-acid ligase II
MTTLADYARIGALTTPNSAALVSIQENRSLSYRDLDERSDRLAAAAIAQGLQPGDRLGCWMTTSIAYVETYLAAAKAGLVIVPINERYTVTEATHIVEDAGIRALFFAAEKADQAAELPLPRDAWRVCAGADVPRGLVALDDLYTSGGRVPGPLTRPQDTFGIVYTSGTTGVPKGATLTHHSVMASNRACAVSYRLMPRGTAIYGASMSFTGTVLGQIFAHLYTCSTIIMTGTSEPEVILRAIRERNATFAGMPPPLIPEFAGALARSNSRLPSLRSLLQSGGKVPLEAVTQLNELLGGRLILAWGMTEISGGAAAASTEADMRAALGGDTRILGTVGRPVPGCVVETVRDAELDTDHEDVYELRIRTDGLMAGYWNRPEDTARAVHDGWYYSGDLGRIDDDGYVSIVDRRTDLIVSGGANVYPSEIERIIAELPAVEQSAVVGLPHDRWGQSVTAVIKVRLGWKLDAQDVLDHCRTRLAGYKKPTAVLFADALPATVGGKIQRARVRALAEAGRYRP